MNDALLCPFIRRFFEDHLICKRNVTTRTLRSYRDAVRLFLLFLTERRRQNVVKLRVADIQEADIVAFLVHLEEHRRNTVQTRNHRLSALRQLFSFIASQEPVLAEYCRAVISLPAKRGAVAPEIVYLDEAEITAILNAANRATWLGSRDYTIVLFMYNTGARVQETVDLRRSWIDHKGMAKVTILGKGRKLRTCPLWDETASALALLSERNPHQADDDPHLFLNRFGHPLGRHGVTDIIEKCRQRAARAVPALASKRVTPHTIRHTTAMHLLQSGVDINVIRNWLGHVNLATTHRYAEIDLAMKRRALECCQLNLKKSRSSQWQTSPDVLQWLASL